MCGDGRYMCGFDMCMSWSQEITGPRPDLVRGDLEAMRHLLRDGRGPGTQQVPQRR